MKIHLIIGALAVLSFAGPALAADDEAGRTLPEICKSSGMAGMDKSEPMSGMDAAHQDLMKGMSEMNANMDQGMMAKDIDVAFVCGMLPHHQGAIDMAKAELAHGDDPWAKQLAQKIIEAQTKEIAEMLDWLKTQSK